MNREDFRHHRAKPGKRVARNMALIELWAANNALTHAIIGYVAGDPKGEAKKAQAQADIDKWTSVLLDITHPPKPEEELFLLGDIARTT